MNCINIVNFRSPHFLKVQLPLVKKYLSPDAIHVFDTSGFECGLMPICAEYGAQYTFLRPSHVNPSFAHAAALNYAYITTCDKYEKIGFIDHDCFPFRRYDVWSILDEHNFAGIWQVRGDVHYLHPGFLFIGDDAGDLNFFPAQGVDTGGQIKYAGKKVFEFSHKFHSFLEYEEIGGFLMHFIKGSNWHGVDPVQHELRLKQLFERLELLTL